MSFANNDSFTSFLAIWMSFISFPCLIAVARTPAAAKSLQSCPTLCDPIDSSPPGFPVPGILQARTLEWVVISFSNARTPSTMLNRSDERVDPCLAPDFKGKAFRFSSLNMMLAVLLS